MLKLKISKCGYKVNMTAVTAGFVVFFNPHRFVLAFMFGLHVNAFVLGLFGVRCVLQCSENSVIHSYLRVENNTHVDISLFQNVESREKNEVFTSKLQTTFLIQQIVPKSLKFTNL